MHAPPKSCVNDVLAALKYSFEDVKRKIPSQLRKATSAPKVIIISRFLGRKAVHTVLASKDTMSIKCIVSKKHANVLASTANFIKNRMPNREKLAHPSTRLTKGNAKF